MRAARGPRGLLVLTAALLVIVFGASPAKAAFGIDRWEALTCNTDVSAPGLGDWAANGNPCLASDEQSRFYKQAAGHPPFGINAFLLNQLDPSPVPDGLLKTTRTELPEGLGVNPQATSQCSVEQLAEPVSAAPPLETKCTTEEPGSLIGVAYLTTILPGPTEATVPAFVYNIETPDDPSSPYYGAPALAGFNASGEPTYLVGDLDPKDQHISFNSQPDLHAPPPFVIGFRLVFFGRSGSGYVTLPSECANNSLTSNFKAVSQPYPAPPGPEIEDTASSTTSYVVENCAAVPFDPGLDVTATGQTDSPEPATVDVQIPFNPDPEGITNSQLKTAKVILPEGAGLNPSVANGLQPCTDAQFNYHTNNPIECPAASQIGSVEVETPSLPGVLGGSVWVAQPLNNDPTSGNQFRIFIQVFSERFGVNVRLIGRIFPNLETGQLTALVEENPQAPFESFKVHIDGGPRGALTSPDTCGPHTTNSVLTPFSGNADATPSDSFALDEIAGGGPCPKTLADRPFDPYYASSPGEFKAGQFTEFRLDVGRDNGNQEVKRIEVKLPPGMVAKLRGLEYCPQANIDGAGARSGVSVIADPACPDSSWLGTAKVATGTGELYEVTGNAYLAGPYKGAPLSAVFITPAVAGPFDLGNVVVRTALNVDPETAEVHAVSDPIPDVFGGVKLDIRQIRLFIDRSNFTINPTTCRERLPIETKLFGGGGNPADPSAWKEISKTESLQFGQCKKLRFKPKFFARIFGGENQVRRAANPKFRAVLDARDGDANLRRAAFILPPATILDQSHIRTICTRVQLAADNCPKASIYGNARATSPLLKGRLQGPVYLTSSDNELPDLLVDLKGQVDIQLRGVISSKNARLKTVFRRLPDVAVNKFILTMKGGNRGLLVNSQNLCDRTRTGFLNLLAQNSRRERDRNLRLNIPACRKG